MIFSFPMFITFYNTTHSENLLVFLDFDTLRKKSRFAFSLQMFPLHNSERSNVPSAKATLKYPLTLVQYKVFWLVVIAF